MVKDGSVRFIDFQAGRLGPLGYDVASLLIDPYAALTPQFQEELLDFYGSLLAARRPGSEEDFIKYYSFLALQRNLQIVGAFAFLSKVRGKAIFYGLYSTGPSFLAKSTGGQQFCRVSADSHSGRSGRGAYWRLISRPAILEHQLSRCKK